MLDRPLGTQPVNELPASFSVVSPVSLPNCVG